MVNNFVPELASFLLKSNALRFGIFKLSSGIESPYYIDLRTLPSFPKHFRLTIGALRDIIMENVGTNFDYLASVPTSGLIFTSSLAYEMTRPMVYVRKESKEYGTGKMVEGYLKAGSKVLVIDDVATTGASVSKAIETIRANGGVVEYVVAILDRLEGASERLNDMGVGLLSVCTINDIVNVLYKAGLIDNATLDSVIRQVRGEPETD